MKKYGICLLLCLLIAAACAVTGYTAGVAAGRRTETSMTEAPSEPVETLPEATEPVSEEHEAKAANQPHGAHENRAEEYYLVAEDGLLLVFLKDQENVYLYTHVPLMDFPEEERDRLRAGLWFPSMIEVYNYLESYTS
ncbi:MAG: hypothetical protein LUC94_04380 [Clostridiales bacterium]|nr:hypothetical protein [Clostridiales bacterium]